MKGESAHSIKLRAGVRKGASRIALLPQEGSALRAFYDALRSVAPLGMVPRPEAPEDAKRYAMHVGALRNRYGCDITTVHDLRVPRGRGRRSPTIVGWRLLGEETPQGFVRY